MYKTISFNFCEEEKTYSSWWITLFKFDKLCNQVLPGCIRCDSTQIFDHRNEPWWEIYVVLRLLNQRGQITHKHIVVTLVLSRLFATDSGRVTSGSGRFSGKPDVSHGRYGQDSIWSVVRGRTGSSVWKSGLMTGKKP